MHTWLILVGYGTLFIGYGALATAHVLIVLGNSG